MEFAKRVSRVRWWKRKGMQGDGLYWSAMEFKFDKKDNNTCKEWGTLKCDKYNQWILRW